MALTLAMKIGEVSFFFFFFFSLPHSNEEVRILVTYEGLLEGKK